MQSVREHLLSRYLDLHIHRPIIDEDERVATFFLWNLSGQLVGYQQYRPDADKTKRNHPRDGRYYTRRSGVGVWGLESIHRNSQVLFVFEGIFDAARVTRHGASAVAVLSNDPDPTTVSWLRSLPYYRVAVCDNNAAGRKLAKLGHTSHVTDTDLGDAEESQVMVLLQTYLNN